MNGDRIDIAIVGLACILPGASTPGEFWQNLQLGSESVIVIPETNVLAAGADKELLGRHDYVRSEGILPQRDLDQAQPCPHLAGDVAQNLLLSCATEALSSIDRAHDQPLGVFIGSTPTGHFLSQPPFSPVGGHHHSSAGLHYASRSSIVSYRLNLMGPSLDINSGTCSSLLAVHVASQSLRNRECDVAIAGGVSLREPHGIGYFAGPGSILSPSGHCRAFDAAADGTVPGSGVGLVTLMRAEDALAMGCEPLALVIGSATNNDGGKKIGYTAPSLNGQSEVVARALSAAGISVKDISYLEAHGTGTLLGDAIELLALESVWETHQGAAHRACGIGSVKTSIGHLDSASGIASLIKVVLSLKNRQLPPSLNFTKFGNHPAATSRFYVVSSLSPWGYDNEPLYAGVSSFGIGGTNVHLIVATPTARRRDKRVLRMNPPSNSDARLTSEAQPARRFVFMSYLREDSEMVGELAGALQRCGVHVWLDRFEILPGTRWRAAIREAIRSGGLFIACFSDAYYRREISYMNEELILAIDELRKMPRARQWFVPVRLTDAPVPDLDIGAGETLQDLQWVALHDNWYDGFSKLLAVIQEVL